MTLSEQARQYAILVAQKRAAEAAVDELSRELTRLEADLLQHMGDEGVSSLKVQTDEGKFTLFPRRELWASCVPGHEEELHKGLRGLEMGDLVKESVNSQRLSAYIRELDVTGTAIPQSIIDAVKVTEKFRVGVRKA